MTATLIPQAADGRPRLLHLALHPREAWHLWRDDVRTARQSLARPEHRLITGETARFRFLQMTIWGIAAGFVGACAIAGVYYGLFEVYWHMPFGWFGVHGGGSLKPWWDNLFPGDVWPAFRHAAFRDIPEPVFALLAVQTLLAKPPKDEADVKPVTTRQIIIAPLVIVFVTFALGALSVWLLDFAGPNVWHYFAARAGHPDDKLDHSAWLGRWSVGFLAAAFAIKYIVKKYWAPVGFTLQGFLLDRSIDRAQAIANNCLGPLLKHVTLDVPETAVEFDRNGWHLIPWIVRLPLTPPVFRERFAHMWRANTEVSIRNTHGRVIGVIVAALTVLVIIGFIGHYLIGSAGIAVPYFSAAPPQ